MAPPRRPTLNNSDAPELELGAHGSRESRGQHGTLKVRARTRAESSGPTRQIVPWKPLRVHAPARPARTRSFATSATRARRTRASPPPLPTSPSFRPLRCHRGRGARRWRARAAPYVSPPPPPPGEESTQDEAWPSLAAPAPRAPAPPAPPHAHASEDAPEGEFSEVMSCVSTVVSEGGGDGEIFAWSCSATRPTQTSPPPTPRSTTRWMTRTARGPSSPAAAPLRSRRRSRPRHRRRPSPCPERRRRPTPSAPSRTRTSRLSGCSRRRHRCRHRARSSGLAAARGRVQSGRRRRRRRRRQPRASGRRRRALCAAHEAVETSLGVTGAPPGEAAVGGRRRRASRRRELKRRSPAHETPRPRRRRSGCRADNARLRDRAPCDGTRRVRSARALYPAWGGHKARAADQQPGHGGLDEAGPTPGSRKLTCQHHSQSLELE